jgi:hypothetical protein
MLIILPTTYKWVQIQMIPKHQQINVWMNMSETPEKKKARLRYDNVFKTAWTDEFHFIKHSRKGNKFAFCEFCKTTTECTILHPSEKNSIFSWFYYTIFKVLTTQILYPKCNRMHHFASFWKKHFLEGANHPPTAFSLSRVGMYA